MKKLYNAEKLKEFPNYESLNEICLSYKQIITIDSNTFCGCNELREIYLDNNQIQTIHANTFNGCFLLDHLRKSK